MPVNYSMAQNYLAGARLPGRMKRQQSRPHHRRIIQRPCTQVRQHEILAVEGFLYTVGGKFGHPEVERYDFEADSWLTDDEDFGKAYDHYSGCKEKFIIPQEIQNMLFWLSLIQDLLEGFLPSLDEVHMELQTIKIEMSGGSSYILKLKHILRTIS